MKIQLRVKIRALPSDSNWANFLLFCHSMLTVTNVASSVKLLQVYYSMHQLCLQHIDSDAERRMDHLQQLRLASNDSDWQRNKCQKDMQIEVISVISMSMHGHLLNHNIHHRSWIMAALWNRAGQAIIFLSCSFFFFLSSFFPRIFSAVRDWMSTILPHMMWP